MKILIIGAGAVGKVYGRHLSLGGTDVSFLVKEKYLPSLQKGLTFYELNRTQKNPIDMNTFNFLTSYDEVKKQKWDYVILSVASTALKEAWVDEMISSLGSATLVTLQPGMHDHELLIEKMKAALISADRLIDGTIPIVSYEAPLPGEVIARPGTAYWLPPGALVTLKGESSLVSPLLNTFNQGGLKTEECPIDQKENVVAGPLLTYFVLALESCDWSFAKIKKSPQLDLACVAIKEAIQINAVKLQVSPPMTWFIQPLLIKVIISVSRWIVPFDFETYLKVHFTKVGKQIHQALDDCIEYGQKHQLKTDQLELFKKRIPSSIDF